MPQFTPEQCNLTAEQFHDLANAVFQQRMGFLRSGFALNDPLIIKLQSRQIDLTRISIHYALETATLTLDDAETAAGDISTAISRATNALPHCRRIDMVISIASAAINLSLGAYSANLDQIATTAQALNQALSDASASHVPGLSVRES